VFEVTKLAIKPPARRPDLRWLAVDQRKRTLAKAVCGACNLEPRAKRENVTRVTDA
jgi:hypothetical protein